MSVSNPLINAVQRNDMLTARRLLNSDSININSQGGPETATPLYYAAKQGSIEMVELLLDHKQCHLDLGSSNHVTPFIAACAEGNIFVAQHLADNGCNTDKADYEGRTAAHYTAMCGEVTILKYLIQKLGHDKNARDGTGHSPMHLAVINNQNRAVSLVIKCGGDINTFNSKGETPLWSACHLGLVELAKVLIHEILLYGSRFWLDEVDQEGRSSIFEAVCGKHLDILQYLIKAGADVNICRGRDGKKPFTGYSPLLMAIKQAQLPIVTAILQAKGCDVDAPFRGQNVTPLHWTVILDSEISTQWREDPVINEQLGSCPIIYIQILHKIIEHKPNLDTLDEQYHSPLHTACSLGNTAVVKLLCQHRVELDKRCKKFLVMDNEAENRLFLTGIEMALLKGQWEIVRELVLAGAQFVIADWMQVPELRTRLEDNPTLLQWIKENRK